MNINTFCDSELQINGIIEYLKKQISYKLSYLDNVVIAVSGGKSPINFFNRLSMTDLPYDKIIFTLIDERIVNTNNEDSNENLVKKHLLINNLVGAKFLSLYKNNDNIITLNNRLENINFNIDIGILGMGEDGHFASIFKCSKEFNTLIDLSVNSKYSIVNPTSVNYQRISLTLTGILAIPELVLCINGINKLNVLKDMSKDYPIYYLMKNRPNLPVFWYE